MERKTGYCLVWSSKTLPCSALLHNVEVLLRRIITIFTSGLCTECFNEINTMIVCQWKLTKNLRSLILTNPGSSRKHVTAELAIVQHKPNSWRQRHNVLMSCSPFSLFSCRVKQSEFPVLPLLLFISRNVRHTLRWTVCKFSEASGSSFSLSNDGHETIFHRMS